MKYTFSLALLALLLIPMQLHASATWVEKDSGSIQGYRGIASTDAHLVAVGNSGNILSSSDAGTTWNPATSPSTVWMYDVAHDGGGSLIAVGEQGVYLVSSDHGESWSQLSFGFMTDLYDIDLTDANGYITGKDGALYYRINDYWFQQDTGLTDAFYAVHDMGDGTAWVVGANGRLVVLSNSGISYQDKGQIIAEHLHGVHFVSSTEGWVVGTNGTLRKTTTAGSSWVDVPVDGLSNQDLFDIRVLGNQITVVGENVVLLSEDMGETWTLTDFENTTFYAAHYTDAGELYTAGVKDFINSSVYHYEVEEEVVEEPDEEVTEEEQEEAPEAEMGNLVKMTCAEGADVNDPCKAVYYYANDGKRHAFPNERVFYTWYENFDEVIEVSSDFMSSLMLGPNATYHPGTKMVKFLSVPTVYVVSEGNILRAIPSEEVAEALYGTDWNQQIDDISDAFYGNYSIGDPLESAEDYDVAAAEASVNDLNDQY